MGNKRIKIDLLELDEVHGKSELFDYVSGYLLEAGKIESAEVLQEELRWRESMGNTLIEEDFAVPHIESSNVNETSMILTRLKYPVLNWKDDYSANTILFMLIKKEEEPEILQDVKRIIKSLAYEETIELLKQAEKWEIDSALQSL